MSAERIDDIHSFWFGEIANSKEYHDQRMNLWFSPNEDFDRQIKDQFTADYSNARAGEYDAWSGFSCGALALIILLDQFPRNMFRGDPKTWETDGLALNIAKSAIDSALDQELCAIERHFLYMPFMHSENIIDQRRSLELYKALSEEDPLLEKVFPFAKEHFTTIERFGRFPYRNKVLGRETTAEEAEYLARR